MKQDARIIDKRIVERNMDKGLISQKEYDTYLESLPNMESEAEVIDLTESEEEESEEEEPEA